MSFILIFILSVLYQIRGICFVAFGDWGERNPDQARVAFAMSEVVKEKNCSFILSTGDNFYPNGVQSVDDKKWKEIFEDVYHHESLSNKRWYITVGNHDYEQGWKGIQAQINYTKKSNRWYFPSRYYAEKINVEKEKNHNDDDAFFSIQFVLIDTTNIWDQEQQFWIDSILKKSQSSYIFVVGHNPVYSTGRYTNEMANTMLPKWFEKYNVTAYICGHEHHLQHIVKENGIHYFITGGGSYLRPKEKMKGVPTWYAKELGFLMCQIKDIETDSSKCDFFNLEMKVIYSVPISPKNNIENKKKEISLKDNQEL